MLHEERPVERIASRSMLETSENRDGMPARLPGALRIARNDRAGPASTAAGTPRHWSGRLANVATAITAKRFTHIPGDRKPTPLGPSSPAARR